VTFEAYIHNIHAKTGKTPEDFRRLAQAAGLMGADARAMQVVAWLKAEFGLGHGHAMAIWSAFQRNGWVAAAPAKPKAGRTA
jgi:hypothetical protein